MPEKDLTVWHFVLVGIMGLWGALINIIDKIKTKKIKQIDVISFMGEILTNLFCTYVAFFICIGMDFSPYYAVGIGGLAGHFGTRSLFLFRKWWLNSNGNNGST